MQSGEKRPPTSPPLQCMHHGFVGYWQREGWVNGKGPGTRLQGEKVPPKEVPLGNQPLPAAQILLQEQS